MLPILTISEQLFRPFCYSNDINFFTFKQTNMNYYQSCAAKGNHPGNRNRHLFIRSMQRAAVNIYKTDNSYEMLLFAPGRIKENFSLNVKGNELIITYTPPEGFPKFDWIQREYSRGGFERSFTLDSNIDISKISAKYVDGVLQVSLPLLAGKEASNQEIPVS
jgi:HSP20 family protein